MNQLSGREILKKGQTITLLRRSDIRQQVTFRIGGVAGEGGSSICYSAKAGNVSGRLKEFYPVQLPRAVSLQRGRDNQLMTTDSAAERRYGDMCRAYAEAYDILEQAKQDSEQGPLLNNYIPACELFLGTGGTVYVWTPSDKAGKNFEDYLRLVRSNPRKLPEHKLYNILNTLITLTDCIRLLHGAGLVYLDIKPSNFLVPFDGDMNINTANISLFDVNSICAPDSGLPKTSGTPGFRAPEAEGGRGDYLSDLYSIGAVLFYAVVVCQEQGIDTYRDAYYHRLDRLVEQSALIRASETNSSPSVKYLLTKILKKSLHADPERRYGCCEELMADLKTAKAYLLPDIFNAHLGLNQRLAILDQGDQTKTNPTAIMQNLLYRVPLYRSLPRGEGELQVLVIGAGTFGQKFMDVCLQTGQADGLSLHITAVSAEAELNRAVYLHYRPALKEFVSVDGAPCTDGAEPYAWVDFHAMSRAFCKGDPETNSSLAGQALKHSSRGWHYVFISLGDDGLNREVAQAIVSQGVCCPVNYVVQSAETQAYGQARPVWVNEPVTPASIDPDLERQAFNIHLLWSDRKKLDIREARAKFRNKYNYTASLASALSIPYKLYSIGLDSQEIARTAEAFRSGILQSETPKAKDIFRRMVAMEHRRWVMEKVTDGWAAPRDASGEPDYESCVRSGKVADPAAKLHPCIVRSGTATPLSDPNYEWNRPTPADWALDPLDRMSVELHRCFLSHAKVLTNMRLLQSEDVLALGRIAAGKSPEAGRAYLRFRHCLQNILNGSQSYCARFGQYEEALAEALAREVPDILPEVSQRLGWIRKAVFPVIESSLYRDYKANDEALIRGIPFILTNVTGQRIAMALDEALIPNIAAAAVLHPAEITYLYCLKPNQKGSRLVSRISSVLRSLRQRNIRCKVTLIAALCSGSDCRELHTELELLRSAGLEGVTLLQCGDEASAVAPMARAAAARKPDLFDIGTTLFEEMGCQQRFVARIRQTVPCFRFDRDSQTFPVHKGCDYLGYIHGSVSMQAEDLLYREEGRGLTYPEFAGEWEKLWDIYTGGSGTGIRADAAKGWQWLCTRLGEDARRRDVITDIPLAPAGRGPERHLVFYIPGFCYDGAKLLVERLKTLGALNEMSAIVSHASDTCRMDLYSFWDLEEAFTALLGKPHLLMQPEHLQVTGCRRGGISHVTVKYDDLVVSGVQLEDIRSQEILEQLHKARFITALGRESGAPGMVRFVYTSHRMKRLLTSPGRMIAVYMYYELRKTGYFDDVVWADGCTWGGKDGIRADIILTKGFRTVLLECSAGTLPDESHQEKLEALSLELGIPVKAAVLLHSQINGLYLPGREKKYDGNTTVINPGQLRDMGQILEKLMESAGQEE